MRNLNHVTLSGNLTRDAELRITAGGTAVLNFGIAVNESRKDTSAGKWVDEPNFIDCVIFGNRGDSIAQYMEKGTKVSLVGRLHQSTWETKDGQKRSKIEVIVDGIEFMTRGEGKQQIEQQENAEFYDADIPF